MELDDEEQWEPYESRGSSTVLRGAGAEMLRPTHSKHCELDSITCSLTNILRTLDFSRVRTFRSLIYGIKND